jgi:DNA-binding NtrC family response regulator
MRETKIRALLLRSSGDDLIPLMHILDQLVKLRDTRSCAEAGRHLRSPNPPHLVFTDTKLPDGTWVEVLRLAAGALKPVNVIVIARTAEVGLYIEAMETGAFDYLTASSLVAEVAHVLRNAAENVLSRRQALDRRGPESVSEAGKRKPLAWGSPA